MCYMKKRLFSIYFFLNTLTLKQLIVMSKFVKYIKIVDKYLVKYTKIINYEY